jgi:hypothetical protein
MNLTTHFFDQVAKAITSLGAVIFVLLMVIAGMIFFSHTLFIEVFPSSMSAWEKQIATWVIALAWELTVLITTCNKEYIWKGIPVVMALASGIIVLFFIQAFDTDQTGLVIAMRWFVGILVATINWIYAELFYAKWAERKAQIDIPSKLVQTESAFAQVQSEVDQLRSTLDQRESRLNEFQSALREREREVNQLRSKVDEFQRELTCPHCKVVQPNPRALNAHKGHCAENPINKAQVHLNGKTSTIS